MKAVNVDEVLKILHKYGKYIFVTDEKKYSDMVDEISNLKALEQEPLEVEAAQLQKAYNKGFEDCRQAVKELIKSGVSTDTYDDVEQVCKWIDDLPSVKQEPKWIPVSERLPEPCTFVNVTCHSLIDDREDWVVETLYLPIPKNHNPMHYSDWGNIPMLNDGDCEVIAWVERIIPEPYKVEPRESEETETWEGIHAQITAPKGTFDRIWEEAEIEDKE